VAADSEAKSQANGKPKRGRAPLFDVTEWQSALNYHGDALVKSAENIALILTGHEAWAGRLAWDEFAGHVVMLENAPACGGLETPKQGDRFDDHHATAVSWWLDRSFAKHFGREMVLAGVHMAARCLTINPLVEYLETRRADWDAKQRVDTFASHYLGCEDTPYSRAVARMWLLSCVARALTPGCQVDHMLVLEGTQGAKKTSALRIMARDWFCPSLPDLRDDKAASERIQGSWICEIGELDALRGASATRVKDFLTRTFDRYRPAYGRHVIDRPRSCVFAGSTNEHVYLVDHSGGRRFWPLRVAVEHPIARDALERDVDQIWSEAAVILECGGESAQFWPTAAMGSILGDEQDARYIPDEWEARIESWCKGRDVATVAEALGSALMIEPGKWTQPDQNRVARCLIRLGFERKQCRDHDSGRRSWIYQRENTE
jgi:putative DNA primase/helicase